MESYKNKQYSDPFCIMQKMMIIIHGTVFYNSFFLVLHFLIKQFSNDSINFFLVHILSFNKLINNLI